MKSLRVKVFGEVQNVGFRAMTRHRARKLGVSGWVKNNDDGTVEALFQGTQETVDDMVDWCRKGPPTSYVERIEISEEPDAEKFKGFDIIY
jgi:acylphosphatase